MKVKEKSNSRDSDAEKKIEKDLKSCMKCHFFWGNDSRCITNQCYEEKKETVTNKQKSECDDCPYKQNDSYCFPCMKKIMGMKADETDVENQRKY